jgi:hypothetical protein
MFNAAEDAHMMQLIQLDWLFCCFASIEIECKKREAKKEQTNKQTDGRLKPIF